MNEKNQIKSGAVLSYINLAISTMIPFFYTPVMLRMLGDAEYGLYSLSNSVISYLSLLSFGFGGTIVRYISMYRAKQEREQLERTFGFFLLLYCGMATVVILCGFGLANNVDVIFQKGLTSAEIQKMHTLVLIMAFSSALSFVNSVYYSITVSFEKFIFRKLADMVATIATPIANLIFLYLGYASVGMACISVAIQCIVLITNMWYCTNIIRITPRFTKMPGCIIKEMVGFSAFMFIDSIVDMLFWSTDKVILGMLASSVAVAVYNIGCTFNSMITSLSSSISSLLTPRITSMVMTDASPKELTELFIRVGRIQYIIVGLAVSGFIAFGQTFIMLWAGPAYRNAYWIALVTMIPLSVPLIQNTGYGILVAQNKHRFRAVVYLFIAIINVISTYLVVPVMGGVGAALCSCVSYLVGQGIVMNIYYYKVTKINIPLFWKNIVKMSVTPAVLLILGITANNYHLFDTWFSFFLGVTAYSVLYMAGMYLLALNESEKNIMMQPLRKIIARIAKNPVKK